MSISAGGYQEKTKGDPHVRFTSREINPTTKRNNLEDTRRHLLEGEGQMGWQVGRPPLALGARPPLVANHVQPRGSYLHRL
jgi:hypothetical protein